LPVLVIGLSLALPNRMTPSLLRDRTKKFAVNVIHFAKTLPKDPISNEIAAQLTDAATSVASNYRAVCRARSRADFINKLGIAIEEADESALWLEILAEAGIVERAGTEPLWQEADELTRILVRSRETARNNRESRNRQSSIRQ
jgi:four helix bundle protein